MPTLQQPPDLADLAHGQPQLIDRACAALDPGHAGVADAVRLWTGGDRAGAATALLAHLRGAPSPPLTPGTPGPNAIADGDRVMADLTPFFAAWDQVPRRPDGGWDWLHDGPHGDREWGWLHNRHSNLLHLLRAWQASGDPAYARRIDAMLWDWVVSNPYPGQRSQTAPWRGLEVFCRAVRWTEIVHALRRTPLLSDATLVAVMASLPDHADYLRRYHAPANNWLTMEMNGLATLGCAWPEFRDAPAWRAYAAQTIAPEPARQCYPDGSQHELTFHYHQVTEGNLSAIARILDACGHGGLLPEFYRAGIARMWEATAATVDQRGFGPLNNDSDEHNVSRQLAERAAAGGRADWRHIASAGREGTAPEGPPSRMLPWAGQLTMRSGWGADDQWAWFDAGPWGSAHQHNDMLHLSVRHGRDLLVDCGRFHYIRDRWRDFFTGTAAHNGLLVDGAGQLPGPPLATAVLDAGDWAVQPEWDFCRGRHGAGFVGLPAGIAHERSVLYRRGRWWLVVDAIRLDAPRRLDWLWHLHPACTPAATGMGLCSRDPGVGNVRVRPLLPGIDGPELVRGREEPSPLGWYSGRYGERTATTTGIWRAQAGGGLAVQAWLVTTAVGEAPDADAVLLVEDGVVRGRIDGDAVEVPLDRGLPRLSPASPGSR